MPLVKGDIAKPLFEFIVEMNKSKQEDPEAVILAFCNKQEELIFNSLKSIMLVFPSGSIVVQGSPSAQVNVQPIVLTNIVK